MAKTAPAASAPGRFIFDHRYLEAVFHNSRGHRVLGKKLLPFSMWHKVQMEHANSPFLAGGKVEIVDLEMAVRICRTRFPTFATYPERRGVWKLLWLLWAERVDVVREKDRFLSYLADYYSPPKLWDTPKKKGQKTPARRDVDDSLSEISLYREIYNCGREEPWDLPIGELSWMNVCGARRQGADIRVFTPTDEKNFRAHVKRREETLARLAKEFAEKEGLSPEEAKKRAHAHYWETVRKNKARAGFTG